MNLEKIKKAKTKFLGKEIIYKETLNSTQDLAKELVKENKYKNGTLVICDSQTNGKGTKGRRIMQIVDEGTFEEINENMQTLDPLNFEGYLDKIKTLQDKTNIKEAIKTGFGKIKGEDVALGVMDANFMMGSMGSVVGEKIACLVEETIKRRLPLILFCTSGGARMQEGIVSLMQMAKTSSSLARLDDEGLLYISVLTDPTTGGVTASFASLGDIIIAEPGSLIGFAGPRVIEQTMKQKLPDGFQKAEFLLEHGFIDKIVERKDMKSVLAKILKMHK